MPHQFRQILEQIAKAKTPGPSATFSVYHLLRALELIAKNPIGRAQLAAKLKVGEGAVRTIISRLRNARLVTTSKAGCALTEKGLDLWKDYQSLLVKVEIGKNELTVANCSSAVLIKNCARKLKSGMEQRDAAVIAGARSATTIISRNGHLAIPSVSDNIARDFPRAAEQILSLLKPREEDAVVVASADSMEKAENGALAAAWTLLNCE
jgi:predicted transcriptional regulator